MKLFGRLWNDEAGFIVTAELAIVATIAVIGMLVGLTTVRDSVTNEIADVAGSIDDLNQSYEYQGLRGHSAVVAGADFVDHNDFCDDDDDANCDGEGMNATDQCVTHTDDDIVAECTGVSVSNGNGNGG